MKAVQFTIDEQLLARLDAEPEVKAHGRSAFIRRAVEGQLARMRERSIREAYRRGYSRAPHASDELLLPPGAQAWPDE